MLSAFLSPKIISYSGNKLIIQNHNLRYKLFVAITICLFTLDAFFGVSLPASLAISIADELFLTTTAMHHSKLNCSRITNQVDCSLTGANLFGNEEKVFNYKYGKLLTATKRNFSIFLGNFVNKIYRNDLLVLITEKDSIYLYTSSDLLDKQIGLLNSFFQNQDQTEISIQANKLFPLNFFSLTGYTIWRYLFSILFYILIIPMIISLFVAKVLIFDKDSKDLTVLRHCNKKDLYKIPLYKIKKVRLDIFHYYEFDAFQFRKNRDTFDINVLDNLGFLLHSIQCRDSSLARKIANSICSFLEIDPFQTTIKSPPVKPLLRE
jgi:hypothetical protein